MSPESHSPAGSVAFGIVVAAVVVGIGAVALGAWRFGIEVVGVALLVAGGVRTFLPERSAGQLRIRRRWSDALWMLALGGVLLSMALLVPEGPSA